jgi:hypothetical protein
MDAFLRAFLADGERPGDDVVDRGNQILGLSKHRNQWLRSLDRIGGSWRRTGFGGGIVWGLNPGPTPPENEKMNGGTGGTDANGCDQSHQSHHTHHSHHPPAGGRARDDGPFPRPAGWPGTWIYTSGKGKEGSPS